MLSKMGACADSQAGDGDNGRRSELIRCLSHSYHPLKTHQKVLYFTYHTTLHSKHTRRFCILCFAYGSTENTLEYRRVQYRLCFSVFWHYNTEEYRRAPCLHRVQYVQGATQRVEQKGRNTKRWLSPRTIQWAG